MEPKLYPLIFAPIYKNTIWGGRLFASIFNRELPEGLIGESWDVAAHKHGTSVVAEGPLAGRNLAELVREYGEALVGEKGLNDQDTFPLLLKLIDANQDLSIQVHPHDDHVAKYTTETWGKTEMWYIMHAQEGAWIIWGLRPDVTKDEFEFAIAQGGDAILACLNKVKVKAGELYPISAGLVHALGAGVMVAEIQQNSDLTYRVYDWERVDDQGFPRKLHIQEALNVIDFSPQATDFTYQLERCQKHFKLNVLKQRQDLPLDLEFNFQILTALDAQAKIIWNGSTTRLKPGQSCLLPASLGHCILQSKGVVLQSRLP